MKYVGCKCNLLKNGQLGLALKIIKMKKLFFACDHGALDLKNELVEFAKTLWIDFEDLGVNSTDSVDYPDVAKSACERILKEDWLWVLLCGTGIWISIAANKVCWIRAALVHTEYEAKMAKNHNNANVICFGGRVLWSELAKACLKKFLDSEFEGGRHERRVGKLESACYTGN